MNNQWQIIALKYAYPAAQNAFEAFHPLVKLIRTNQESKPLERSPPVNLLENPTAKDLEQLIKDHDY